MPGNRVCRNWDETDFPSIPQVSICSTGAQTPITPACKVQEYCGSLGTPHAPTISCLIAPAASSIAASAQTSIAPAHKIWEPQSPLGTSQVPTISHPIPHAVVDPTSLCSVILAVQSTATPETSPAQAALKV